jgi:DNA-binding response OmpR family regulator
MPRILSISPSEVLRTTRQLILEQEGYQVLSLADPSEGHAFSTDDKFDLAIVGHNFRGQDKRKIAQLINKQFPGLPILELCLHSPEIPGADFILSDSPDEILIAVREILAGRRVRGFLP